MVTEGLQSLREVGLWGTGQGSAGKTTPGEFCSGELQGHHHAWTGERALAPSGSSGPGGGGAPLPIGADLRRACHRIWSLRTRPVKGPLLLLPALLSLLLLLFPISSASQVQSQESLSQSEAHREQGLMGCPLHLPGSRSGSRAQALALSRTKRSEAGD